MPDKIPITFAEENPHDIELIDGELQKIDLGQLADWIGGYHQKFGAIARQGRTGAFLTEQERHEREEQLMRENRDPEEEEIKLAQAVQADIIRRNEKLTEQVGLSIDFPSGEGAEWALDMKLDIGDGKKFTAYLHALRKVTESQAKGLAKVSEVLVAQVTHGYDLDDPEDERLLELVASLKSVVSEYRRIADLNPSLETATRQFEEVYTSVREGCLKEYIVAKDAQLFDSIGKGFGPSTWQRDSSEDVYIKYWSGALDTLAQLTGNPKAKGLYERARHNLLASLEYVEKDMREQKSRLLNNKISMFLASTKEKLQKSEL